MNRIIHETKTKEWNNGTSYNQFWPDCVSQCCHDKVYTSCADEGTCYAVCNKCGKPCEIWEEWSERKINSKWDKFCDFMDDEIMPRLLILMLFAFLISIISGIGNYWYGYKLDKAYKIDIPIYTPKEITPILSEVPTTYETTADKIIRIAKENNFDITVALRIAQCESQFGKYPINWEGSSAKGVYMFTDKSWENYCEGDVLNEEDNIRCFIKLYPEHKNWWICK